jgi:DNA-binding response OmpR family regulator
MKIKVLLVDDEEKFAVMLARRLALREIDVDYVFSGEDALEKVENERYDVTVLDVKMPGVSGIELKRRLTSLDPEMKIVFLTGHGSKNDFLTGTAEGAVYLTKPLHIEKLVALLNELVKRQPGK